MMASLTTSIVLADKVAIPSSHGPAERSRSKNRNEVWLVAASITLVFLIHLYLGLTRSINWDEFHYLNQVHEFARGELSTPLQTLHVRFFAWLTELDLLGVDQIILGRMIMGLMQIATCASIVLIARRFTSLPYAMTCALAYLGVGYVLHHGWSFRTDPFAIALCMSALATLTHSRLGWRAILLFGILLGCAFMVTIKVALLLPAFAGLAWLRWSEDAFSLRRARQIAACALMAGVIAGTIFLLHGLNLAPASEAGTMVNRAGQAMFYFGIPHNWNTIVSAMILGSPFFLLLCVFGWRITTTHQFNWNEKLALIGLAMPLLSLFFYHNTYPYFYVFVLAPVAVALAGAIPFVANRYGLEKLVVLLVLFALYIWHSEDESRLDAQRQIQTAASEMFPTPVSYFDFSGMLTDHKKANFFMSRRGFQKYWSGIDQPLAVIMEKEPVPLLLAVEPGYNPSFNAAFEEGPAASLLFDSDDIALSETYRNVWGPLFVAGIEIGPNAPRSWYVRVPGPYTVEGQIRVNGTDFGDGEIIDLARGKIDIASREHPGGLLWGRNIKIPRSTPPSPPYWTSF